MKTNELRELGAEELSAKIREARKELADLKLKHASGVDVEKPGRMRLMRRNIARLLTIQNEANALRDSGTSIAAMHEAFRKVGFQ